MTIASRGRFGGKGLCGACGAKFERGAPVGELDCPLCGTRVVRVGVVASRHRPARNHDFGDLGPRSSTDGPTLRRVLVVCGVLAALSVAVRFAVEHADAIARRSEEIRARVERESGIRR